MKFRRCQNLSEGNNLIILKQASKISARIINICLILEKLKDCEMLEVLISRSHSNFDNPKGT